jgi:hypothetical protein
MTKLSIAEELDQSVAAVIGEHNIMGFQKAYLIADATIKLQELLVPKYMKPIMALQGNKLGFKTDKDKDGGYPEKVVKNCLIEAVLTGLQPHGNQFNIIAGNMYPTKEGLGHLLGNFRGLSYHIKSELPRINSTNTSAAIVMNIQWSINNGPSNNESIELPIKMNKFMGTDAVIGKATRKARAWLYSTITGSEITDGDISDLDSPAFLHGGSGNHKTISAKKERVRVEEHINSAKEVKVLEQVKETIDRIDDKELFKMYDDKLNELVFN